MGTASVTFSELCGSFLMSSSKEDCVFPTVTSSESFASFAWSSETDMGQTVREGGNLQKASQDRAFLTSWEERITYPKITQYVWAASRSCAWDNFVPRTSYITLSSEPIGCFNLLLNENSHIVVTSVNCSPLYSRRFERNGYVRNCYYVCEVSLALLLRLKKRRKLGVSQSQPQMYGDHDDSWVQVESLTFLSICFKYLQPNIDRQTFDCILGRAYLHPHRVVHTSWGLSMIVVMIIIFMVFLWIVVKLVVGSDT